MVLLLYKDNQLISFVSLNKSEPSNNHNMHYYWALNLYFIYYLVVHLLSECLKRIGVASTSIIL